MDTLRSLTTGERSSRSIAEKNECTVCHEELTGSAPEHSCPNKHTFHRKCLEKWMHISQTCPVCRVLITNLIPKGGFRPQPKCECCGGAHSTPQLISGYILIPRSFVIGILQSLHNVNELLSGWFREPELFLGWFGESNR